jgi:hypothetical protein
MPRAVERADLRAKPQAVGVLEAQADNHEVEFAVWRPQQRVRGIGLALHVMLLFERLHDALGRMRPPRPS